MKLSSKQAFYGFCAGILVVLAGTGFTMYWAKNQLEARRLQINEKRVESQELDDKTARAKTLREQLNELSDIVSVSAEVLPDAKSQENIVGELLSLAANRGISLETIAFDGGSATGSSNPETSQATQVVGMTGVFSLGVQTSVETDYENILQFLEDIENNKRQFEVTNISIAPSATEGSSLFSAQLTLVTYIQP